MKAIMATSCQGFLSKASDDPFGTHRVDSGGCNDELAARKDRNTYGVVVSADDSVDDGVRIGAGHRRQRSPRHSRRHGHHRSAHRRLRQFCLRQRCPAQADGLVRMARLPRRRHGRHAVRFGYSAETDREGTIVAGHPVVLTLLIDNAGTIDGLQIDTDPKAQLYLRKKAFLFATQIKSKNFVDETRMTILRTKD